MSNPDIQGAIFSLSSMTEKNPPKGSGMTEKEAELTKLIEQKDRQIEKLVNVLNGIQNYINTLR